MNVYLASQLVNKLISTRLNYWARANKALGRPSVFRIGYAYC